MDGLNCDCNQECTPAAHCVSGYDGSSLLITTGSSKTTRSPSITVFALAVQHTLTGHLKTRVMQSRHELRSERTKTTIETTDGLTND